MGLVSFIASRKRIQMAINRCCRAGYLARIPVLRVSSDRVFSQRGHLTGDCCVGWQWCTK